MVPVAVSIPRWSATGNGEKVGKVMVGYTSRISHEAHHFVSVVGVLGSGRSFRVNDIGAPAGINLLQWVREATMKGKDTCIHTDKLASQNTTTRVDQVQR